jgi:uncharacterized protein (TIGR03382 family)
MLITLLTPAFACGGMFCDSAAPVDQAAERILFAFDGEMLTTEVQIGFEGRDDNFAWVVPVPQEPELFVSNDALFTQLANATVPTFRLTSDNRGAVFGCMQDYALSAKGDSADSDSGGVSVVSESTVGPYDTVVLQADDSETLVSWLRDQGYGLPGNLEDALAPYVASGQYFVALKLSSDKDSGDLAPLGMRYPATAASIPIQLTAVAAIPDLPIEVFILGPSRAVPDNYLHARINEAAIDWYTGGTNYRAVVARAADEAGGQAFVTDFSDSTSTLAGLVWAPGMIDEDYLASIVDPISWVEAIVFSALPPSSQLNAVLTTFVPAPDGVPEADFLSCPSCYGTDIEGFDAVAATAALMVDVVDVLEAEQARIDAAPHITRLFTTLDAEEMTADPMFVFNADIEQTVSASHTATDLTHNAFFGGDTTRRTLQLSDGREYLLADPNEVGELEAVDSPAALIIEDLSASGEGTVLFDGTDDAVADAQAFSGCGTAGAGFFVPVFIVSAGVLRRRRG